LLDDYAERLVQDFSTVVKQKEVKKFH